MKKYPSIEQFRHIIKRVRLSHDYKGKDENDHPIYEHTSDYPILKFKGTVKLHGTNSSIVKYKNREIKYQSRNNIISLDNDNYSFVKEMSNKDLNFLFDSIDYNDYIAVYGEWCGQTIQSGVGISKLPKMFVIFGYIVDDKWADIIRFDPKQNIHHIDQFEVFYIDIDFNYPELSQEKLNTITQQIENQCPVAKSFGIDGTGEGIVFTCTTDPELKFKSKGEKLSVTKIAKNNAVNTELIKDIKKFVELAVTQNRLLQGFDYMKENKIPVTNKNTGIFVKWIINDVNKEEIDTIEKNNFNQSFVNREVGNVAREWYFKYLDKYM